MHVYEKVCSARPVDLKRSSIFTSSCGLLSFAFRFQMFRPAWPAASNSNIYFHFLMAIDAWRYPRGVCSGFAGASVHHLRDACRRFYWVAEALLRLRGGLAHIATAPAFDARRLRGGLQKVTGRCASHRGSIAEALLRRLLRLQEQF